MGLIPCQGAEVGEPVHAEHPCERDYMDVRRGRRPRAGKARHMRHHQDGQAVLGDEYRPCEAADPFPADVKRCASIERQLEQNGKVSLLRRCLIVERLEQSSRVAHQVGGSARQQHLVAKRGRLPDPLWGVL